MAFWMAFSWPTTLYGSILAGQQRLDVMNALKVGAATLSQGGGLIVVLLWRDFHVFLYWIAAVALLSIIAHVVVCRRFSPWMSLRLRPSTDVIRRIWRFSVDVNLIAILAVVYTQLDRLILSRLLPLRMLGYYNAAYSLTRGIGTVQGFVNSAMLPALSSDFGHGRLDEMKGRYSKFSQGLMYLASLPAFFLLFFGFDVLRYWATPDVADAVSRALQILAAGFLLNAAASAPYVLSIATGETKLPLKVNLLGVGLYIPGLIGLTLIWGVDGAALAWLILNLYYLATLLPLTQRRIMRAGAAAWMRANLAPFLLVGVAAFGLMSWLVGSLGRESMATIAIAGASAVAIHTIGGFFMLGSGLRRDARNLSSLVWQDLTPRRKARRLAEIEGGSDRRSPGPDV
jgi:O-antigen/teichoic acid export membrane protein